MDVRDKVVAITGAARGLGQEFARSLAAAGAQVIAADINDCTATLELVAAEWDAAMAVNVKGIWNCCKAAVPAMRQAGGGSIVNIASLAATYGMPYGLHYTTSKAAVIGLTRGLARELGRDRIRVNALAPSAVITEGTREFFGDKLDRALDTIKAGQTIQRNLMPADLVGTVMWLVSDDSGFVTGQTIAVDGGTVML